MNNLNHSRTERARPRPQQCPYGGQLRPMTDALRLFAAALLMASAATALADVHYVDLNCTNATPPYSDWTIAATNIQDAVDAATAGDEIVVTNGIYVSGGRDGNRVKVDKPLTLRSVTGPQFTIIQGNEFHGLSGSGRCVYLTNNASLSGFTLTNGSFFQGGGVFCESASAVVSNCALTGNTAWGYDHYYHDYDPDCDCYRYSSQHVYGEGGGAYGGTLNNCSLSTNTAAGGGQGGGAANCTLNNCTLTGNSAQPAFCADPPAICFGLGGGAIACTLNNCTLVGNSANYGGGADYCTLNNCILSANSAFPVAFSPYDAGGTGGGAGGCTLNNCTLAGNRAAYEGGGAVLCTLNNCSLTGNAGGGAIGCTLTNCIAYFNSGANYDPSCTLNYCCTTPLPASGVGNISADPQLASASHLSALSPCIGQGNYAAVSGTDIDGEPWVNPPSIGCDEYRAGAVTGPLSVAITASFSNIAVGFPVDLTALIEGRTDLSIWDFGDGALEINQPYTAHSWAAPGDYLVSLWAFNDSYPGGISATVTVHVVTGLHYVAANSTNPVAPYTSWTTAATRIQDAIYASEPGAQIVVTNGTYGRVDVHKPLSLRSVNGPQSTLIDGGGSSSCAYLWTNANLSGFTLTNGFSLSGGGVFCLSMAVISNCVITGNRASSGDRGPSAGGGAYGGTLNNCTLMGNSATDNEASPVVGAFAGGGGAAYCTLNNCTLSGNRAYANNHEQIPGGPAPAAASGGGAYRCTLHNCTLVGNSAYTGGGASESTLNNCALAANSGSGAAESALNNCTLTGNSGGGALGCTLTNCVAYFNTGSNCNASCTLSYCCTTPLPTNGVGNISADPQLASASHLSALSPCIGKGSYAAVSGTDIDGEPWANPPSIGCDEYHAGAVTGPLSVSVVASFTNVAVAYYPVPVDFTALIDGHTDLSIWDFGDGALEINEPYTAHSWAMTGDYLVSLWAYNDSYPGGISATVTVHVVTGLHYVAANSANPVASYTSWTTAATNIQDAINAAPEPGAQVVVTNGTYTPITASGTLSLRGMNGPLFTIIDGGQSNQCAFLGFSGRGVSLIGFTLTNGFAKYYGGGGAYGGALSNCTLAGNVAFYGGGAEACTLNYCTLTGNSAIDSGGGAHGCTLNNCTLSGNSATGYYNGYYSDGSGGGAYACTLSNCTLTGNSAYRGGGGANSSTLNNCTLTGNSAPSYGSGGASLSTLHNCILFYNTGGGFCENCYHPGALSGDNWLGDPLFVDTNGWANLRLQSNSPCINAGNNAYAPAGPDLDGNPRIKGGTVDIGAYEFQSPASTISFAWLQQYGLPIDGSADLTDPDGDGLNNWQEWRCGTDPTNALSALRLLTPVVAGTNVTVTWQSVAGVNYFLERSSDLVVGFLLLSTNVPGQPGTSSFTDTNTLGVAPRFYRVGASGQ